MEENKVVMCEKCYRINDDPKNTRCQYCGAKLNNKSENVIKENPIREKNNTNNSSNKVAEKFMLIVMMVKFLGYIGAIISAIMLIVNEKPGFGILAGIIIAIATWFSTLLFEAIAEIIQKLQNIEDIARNT